MSRWLASAVVLLLLLLCPLKANDEKFLPPSFKGAKVIACGVGGKAEYAEAFVIVQFTTGPMFTPTISRRSSAWEGVKDCIAWLKSLEKPLEEASEADLPKPKASVPKP